jgi:3-dehydroquinate synthase
LKKLIVEIPDHPYPVMIGDNLFSRIKKEMSKIPRRQAVIIDRNVDKLHGDRIRKVFSSIKGDTEYFILKSGESAKSLTELTRMYKFLLKGSYAKDSILFAVGGGVTGDTSGFAASTYKRGIPLIHIPTTLLSAIDSSIGGKTALNIDAKKNVIGTFYQPDGVYIDLNFLDTLPKPELSSGIGELIKYTFLSELNFFFYVLNNLNKIDKLDYRVLESIIFRCASIKASIVAKDEKEESGLRKILNFGHTFAHAFESVLNYRIKHGEAVTAGIIAALHLSNRIGLLPENRLITYLKLPQKLKLPASIKRFEVNEIIEAMKEDKKNKDGKINFVLISEIGSLLIDVSVKKEDISYSIDKLIETI